MSSRSPQDEQIRTQIELINARHFSTDDIETRIARALVKRGKFHDDITAKELEVILRNVVYVMFAQQRVVGMDLGLLHNVPVMNVTIDHGKADVEFVVHIHKPIVAFIEFKYTLINDPAAPNQDRLCVKDGTLEIDERTRRFDVKAKAALAATSIERTARQELADPAQIIFKTLPDRLWEKGVTGELAEIALSLNSDSLRVFLRGDFKTRPLPE